MTAAEAVRIARARLEPIVDVASTEAEQLVMHVLRSDRVGLYLVDEELKPEAIDLLYHLISERERGVPLQYLTGTQQFRGLVLEVGPGVLVPRPETEQMVSRALRLVEDVPSPLILDIGTGSGAVALSIAVERPDAVVLASEISETALRWAHANVAKSGTTNVKLYPGNLFDPFDEAGIPPADLVISNPPYLSHEEVAAAAPEVRDHEPLIALLAGSSGLEVPLAVVRGAVTHLKPGGYLIMEVSEVRAEQVASAMRADYQEVVVGEDLAGKPRFVEGVKPSLPF